MGSSAFLGIAADVKAIVVAIPQGRVTTFQSIGKWMTVQPRHVAYILSRLAPGEQDTVPWQRVVSANGVLPKQRLDYRGQTQSELLLSEKTPISAGRVENFDTAFIDASELASSVLSAKNYSEDRC